MRKKIIFFLSACCSLCFGEASEDTAEITKIFPDRQTSYSQKASDRISQLEHDVLQLRKERLVAPFNITTDFLYWEIQEEGLLLAFSDAEFFIYPIGPGANDTGILINAERGRVKRIPAEWIPGFRLAIGYNFDHDLWNLGLNWIRFDHSITNNVSSEDGKFLIAQWLTYQGPIFNHPTAFKSKWSITINDVTLDVSRLFWMGGHFSLRPAVGLETAWIDQHLDLTYHMPPAFHFRPPFTNIDFRIGPFDVIKNRCTFWGMGPKVELASKWYFGKRWKFNADLGLSFLYGSFDARFFQTQTEAQKIHSKDRFSLGRLKPQTSLGVEWETFIAKNRQHLSFHLAWEQQFWLGMNKMTKWMDFIEEFVLGEQGQDLTLQGVTVGGRWDF